MAAMKTWCAEPSAGTPTRIPFRSRIARTRSFPNSSKQPTWIPARKTIGNPASIGRGTVRRTPCRCQSFPPRTAGPGSIDLVGDVLHIGEAFGLQQFLGDVLRRDADPRGSGAAGSVVVSGGGSAASDSGFRPRSPAVPARVIPRNSRRLQPSACRLFMGHLNPARIHCPSPALR